MIRVQIFQGRATLAGRYVRRTLKHNVSTTFVQKEDKLLQVKKNQIVDDNGQSINMRGFCIGGWMNMEHNINGHPGDEHGLRRVMADLLGPDKARFFFDRLLNYFFAEDDVAFIKACGANMVRLPLNYRHFEDDGEPFHYLETGFQRLEQAVKWCAQHGLHVILDLHAVQGFQNSDWHSDNSSRHTFFWHEAQYQDRFVALWEEFARRYKGNATIAGYNVMNEPIVNAPAGRFSRNYNPDWDTLNRIYRRVVGAIRKIDPEHIIFLEGDYYSTQFDGLDAPFDENLVYSSHIYTRAGHGPGSYPGTLDGVYWDKNKLREIFEIHSGTRYAQKYNVPLWVGEFGARMDGPQEEWPDRCRSLDDQLEIFDSFSAHWTSWTYKDVCRHGWVVLDPESEYLHLIAPVLEAKRALGLETYWSGGQKDRAFDDRLNDTIDYIEKTIDDPDIDHAANKVYLSQALLGGYVTNLMQPKYAKRFVGMSESDLDRVLQSFAFKKCRVREDKTAVLKKHLIE
jgi:endoglucanase